MKELKIAKNLSLPLNAATQKIACLGMTGSGKSYLQTKIVEFFLDNDVQTIYLDPKGEGWGLRLMADGKTPAFSIPVFGGEHGDYPLNHTMGKYIAETLVQGDYSAILDVSEFISSELAQFGYDFATRLFQLKKKKPGAMSLVIDEAQDFIPQNPQEKGYEQKMLGAFERIGKQLRSKGVGMVIAGQRPQEINKKVLNMCEIWFAFQMTGLSERETMEKIFRDKDREEANKVFQVLPQLEVGQAHIWSPRFLKVSDNYNILPKKTLDTSATPEVGGKKVVARKLSQLDDKTLSSAMEKIIQEAKENDPVELKKQVAELKKENAKLAANKNIQQPAKNVASVVKPSNDRAYRAAIDKREKEIGVALKTVYKIKDKAMDLIADLTTEINKVHKTLEPLGIIPKIEFQESVHNNAPSVQKIEKSVPKTHYSVQNRTNNDTNSEVGNGSLKRILVSLAQFPEGLSDKAIGNLCGIRSSTGSFGTYLSTARKNGWISGERSLLKITDEGLNALGSYDPLPTGEELFNYWKKKLGNGSESKIFEAIYLAHPDTISDEEIASRLGISHTTGSFGTYLSNLRGINLITGKREALKASDSLFD